MKEKTTLLLPLFKAGHHHGDGDDDGDHHGDGGDGDDGDHVMVMMVVMVSKVICRFFEQSVPPTTVFLSNQGHFEKRVSSCLQASRPPRLDSLLIFFSK